VKRGRKKGEDREIRTLGTKCQPRQTSEVDALLKWMPDLLARIRTAESWPDPNQHPHIPAVLLRAVGPLIRTVAEALDGRPARLERLYDQIVSTGNRRKRTIPELDQTLRPLLEDPEIEWLPNGNTSATLAKLHQRVRGITKMGLQKKLKRFGIRYGVKP
jgi:hypothetical protein